jgi:hypothetical protein
MTARVVYVLELANDLQSTVQKGDHVVQAVSDHGNLLHVVSVGVQFNEGDGSLQQGRPESEEPA